MKINLSKFISKDSQIEYLLIFIGLLAPLGYMLDYKPLRGIGLAYMVSPLPIVFSDVNGYEAFGSDFNLKFYTDKENFIETKITNKEGAKILGPYNRRNVYGAVIGYAPRIPEEIFQSVMKHGFCRNDILVNEFNLPKNLNKLILNIKDNTRGRENKNYTFEVLCSR